MGPLVPTDWLRARLGRRDLVVIDCRYRLDDPGAGEALYARSHIPGAVFFDLDRDLSAPKGRHGGRHPLPSPEALAEKLGKAGIDAATTVVAYDDGGGSAPRAWWLLRYLGHNAAAVLDGGFGAWTAEGHPVTAEVPRPQPRTFTPRPRPEMVVDVEAVRRRGPDVVLIDARAPERYRGVLEPIDPKAGHIPGAVNLWWQEGLDRDGKWLPPEAQEKRFRQVAPDAEVIVYCGSGVTACANILALELAGRPGAKLYAGSFSDWCSYDENPVVGV